MARKSSSDDGCGAGCGCLLALWLFVAILPFLTGALSMLWGLWPSLLAGALAFWIARDPDQSASRWIKTSRRSLITTILLTLGFLGNAFWLWSKPDALPGDLRYFAPPAATIPIAPKTAP